LDVAECDSSQRTRHEGKEPVDIGAVGALGVRRATVEPEIQEAIIIVDLAS
jgi:hypothetical protein